MRPTDDRENKGALHDAFGHYRLPKELEAAQPAFLNFMDNAEKGLVQRKQMDRGLIDFDKFAPSLFNVEGGSNQGVDGMGYI